MSVSGMSMIHCITNHDESGQWFWFSQRIKSMIATTIKHTILPKQTSYGSLSLSNLLDWHLDLHLFPRIFNGIQLSILTCDKTPSNRRVSWKYFWKSPAALSLRAYHTAWFFSTGPIQQHPFWGRLECILKNNILASSTMNFKSSPPSSACTCWHDPPCTSRSPAVKEIF